MGRTSFEIIKFRHTKHQGIKHQTIHFFKMSFFEPIYLDIDLSGKQPVVRQTNPYNLLNCKPSTNKVKNILYIELPEYKSQNIQVAINKSGRVSVNASKTNITDTGRNGQRKTTVHVEQNFDLPEYLVKENLLKEVKSKFDSGRLTFSFPEKPVGVKMQIHFDEDEQMTIENEEQSCNENQNKSTNEDEKIDFEIVKIADADGDSEISIE